MSADLMLGIAVGGFGYFFLDNVIYPWLARVWVHHQRASVR